MQGFRPTMGNPPGVPHGSCRHEVRARLPLAAPDTVPPPMFIEIEADEPDDNRVPTSMPDATSAVHRQLAGGGHLALVFLLAAAVVLLAWAL